jgi:hypothetical protein
VQFADEKIYMGLLTPTSFYKPISDGWLILPVTALAAATAGLAR